MFRLMVTAASTAANGWMLLLIFLFAITWPLMLIPGGGTGGFYFDTFHAMWIRIGYFVAGALVWMVPSVMFVGWIFRDIFNADEDTITAVQFVAKVVYVIAAGLFVLSIVAHG